MRAITLCGALTPEYGYDNSSIILIGDACCPNTKCSCTLCLHKRTFQSLSRNDYQCVQCACVCQVRNIPFEDQTKSFFFSLARGVYILKGVQINWRCYWRCVLSWQVVFQQREMRFSWWWCNNSEIHLCLWKLWSLFVCTQSSFYNTRARKADKNRQNMLFLC